MSFPDFDISFEQKDYAIGGKMVTGTAVLPDAYVVQAKNDHEFREHVRKTLVSKLAEAILENRLVEINQVKDPLMGNTKLFVRAYLAPDDQVKILRTVKR